MLGSKLQYRGSYIQYWASTAGRWGYSGSRDLTCTATAHQNSSTSPATQPVLYCASHGITEIWSLFLEKRGSLGVTTSHYSHRASEAAASHGKQAWSQNHVDFGGLCSQLSPGCSQQYFCLFRKGFTKLFGLGLSPGQNWCSEWGSQLFMSLHPLQIICQLYHPYLSS